MQDIIERSGQSLELAGEKSGVLTFEPFGWNRLAGNLKIYDGSQQLVWE